MFKHLMKVNKMFFHVFLFIKFNSENANNLFDDE